VQDVDTLRTLQELIAPSNIRIYTGSWKYIGTRSDHAEALSTITHIDSSILSRDCFDELTLDSASIAQRMSWASQRQTTRAEDLTYCLFGLFDVHLPPLYGEGGEKAFRRLQEEIITRTTDMSILAWSPQGRQGAKAQAREQTAGVLADSPQNFAGCGGIRRMEAKVEPFRMTNKGLRLKIKIARCDRMVRGCATFTAVLANCHDVAKPGRPIGISVVEIEDVGWRMMDPVYSIGSEELRRARVDKIYLAT
jgi:hypothetical protein